MASLKSLVWGNESYEISQGFGSISPGTAYMYDYATDYGYPAGSHIALDVAVPRGTNIYAAQDGTVTEAGFSPWFRPSPVHVLQSDGTYAIYGHLWSNAVRAGQKITKGQLLGTSGEQTVQGTWTPDGTGPHIHFELRAPDPTQPSGWKAIDPTSLLSGATGPTTGGGSGNAYQYGYDIKQKLSGIWQRPLLALGGIVVALIGVNALSGGMVTSAIPQVRAAKMALNVVKKAG